MSCLTKQSIRLPQLLCFSFKHIEITHHYRVVQIWRCDNTRWHVINYLIIHHNNMIKRNHTANVSTESRLDWVRWVNLTDWSSSSLLGICQDSFSGTHLWTESPPTFSARFDHGSVNLSRLFAHAVFYQFLSAASCLSRNSIFSVLPLLIE